MFSPQKVSLGLTYLVSLGAFLSLYGIASTHFFFPLLILFLLGFVNDMKFKAYLPRWVLTAGGTLLSVYFLLELSLENPIGPFANVLLLLIAVKSLEEKKSRDMYQMLLLSLFGVAVTTTFRLDVSFLIFFLYELFLGSVAFMFINLYSNVGDRHLPGGFLIRYAKFSVLFPLSVAVLSVPFFFLLPRTHAPLFDIFAKKDKGLVSGIADQVELGKVGSIQQDNTVVMRVYGDIPEDPYWRVSVFDTFVGNKWVRTFEGKEEEVPVMGKFAYTVVLEPTYDTFLPALDYPVRIAKLEGIKAKAVRLVGGVYESTEVISRPIRYRALSSDQPPADVPDPVYLEVPDDLPESIVELARRLSEGKGSEEEKVLSVKEFFRDGFSYTLNLEPYEGNPLENFLFRSKSGNCEYFASSTALLLRLMGVPSRVVGGFRGVLKNTYGGYYIVTNSMAHVWVEAYVGGKWIRIDTTPPYVPPILKEVSKLDLIRDALIYFWYENVVGFSAQKQAFLLRNTLNKLKNIDADTLKSATKYLLLLALPLLGIYYAVVIYKRIRKSPVNLYGSLISKLERLEGKDIKNLLPEELLSRVKGKPYYGEVRFIVFLYQKHRFSNREVSKKELEEGYRMLRKIH